MNSPLACVCIYRLAQTNTSIRDNLEMPNEKQLVIETPEMHGSQRMQSFISQEISRPCKQWIHQVISAKRETERIKLRTEEFVLLPDVECINKGQYIKATDDRQATDESPEKKSDTEPPVQIQSQNQSFNPKQLQTRRANQFNYSQNQGFHRFNQGFYPGAEHVREHNTRINRTVREDRSTRLLPTAPSIYTAQPEHAERRWRMKRGAPELHWLAVVTDPALRTLRDLRGAHIQMLTKLQEECCRTIQAETGIPLDQIIAYVHYPPSVYQLHVHFKHPISSHTSYDAFRMHSLASIINNLRIDQDYYAVSNIQLPVYQHTELFAALGLARENDGDSSGSVSPG